LGDACVKAFASVYPCGYFVFVFFAFSSKLRWISVELHYFD